MKDRVPLWPPSATVTMLILEGNNAPFQFAAFGLDNDHCVTNSWTDNSVGQTKAIFRSRFLLKFIGLHDNILMREYYGITFLCNDISSRVCSTWCGWPAFVNTPALRIKQGTVAHQSNRAACTCAQRRNDHVEKYCAVSRIIYCHDNIRFFSPHALHAPCDHTFKQLHVFNPKFLMPCSCLPRLGFQVGSIFLQGRECTVLFSASFISQALFQWLLPGKLLAHPQEQHKRRGKNVLKWHHHGSGLLLTEELRFYRLTVLQRELDCIFLWGVKKLHNQNQNLSFLPGNSGKTRNRNDGKCAGAKGRLSLGHREEACKCSIANSGWISERFSYK